LWTHPPNPRWGRPLCPHSWGRTGNWGAPPNPRHPPEADCPSTHPWQTRVGASFELALRRHAPLSFLVIPRKRESSCRPGRANPKPTVTLSRLSSGPCAPSLSQLVFARSRRRRGNLEAGRLLRLPLAVLGEWLAMANHWGTPPNPRERGFALCTPLCGSGNRGTLQAASETFLPPLLTHPFRGPSPGCISSNNITNKSSP